MEHSVTVVARTFEVDNNANMDKDLTVLSGKAAGVCYMPDDYTSVGMADGEKAFARALSTGENGHHSVFGHGHISFIINTSKILAMVLNSIGFYNTSEKSARYTVMKPETERELEVYNKWKSKLCSIILDRYPDYDDAELRKRFNKKFADLVGNDVCPPMIKNGTFTYCEDQNMWDVLDELKKSDTLPSRKLAQENARYMISVFTPTTMMYSISYREVIMLVNHLERLSADCSKNSDEFYIRLGLQARQLASAFRDEVWCGVISDIKNQYIRLFELCDETKGYDKSENIGDSYTLRYTGSLAMLAQAHRHRTLRYSMYLPKQENRGYFVPYIISDNPELRAEWIDDINSVAYCTPQGTLVEITEQGIFEDFALKCKERICGRAQLEISKSTVDNLGKFLANRHKLCKTNQDLLMSMTERVNGVEKLVPRCKFKDFKCREGCYWGPNCALYRDV